MLILPALLPFLCTGHLYSIFHVVYSFKGISGIEFNAITICMLNAQDIVTKQHLWKGGHVHFIC